MESYLIGIVVVAVYMVIGLGNAMRSSGKLLKIMRCMGLPVSWRTVAFGAALACLFWPIDAVAIFLKFLIGLWRARKQIKAWVFGYHPPMAAAVNAIDMWRLLRVPLREAMVDKRDFDMLDSHLAELAHYCHERGYGPPVVDGLWPQPWLDKPEEVK